MRPEVYCTLSSRSIVTRVASPLTAARIRCTCGIPRDPLLLADLPPECAGASARGSSILDHAVFAFEAALFASGGTSPFRSRANSASASCASRFLGERG